jgi:hypothetical protein
LLIISLEYFLKDKKILTSFSYVSLFLILTLKWSIKNTKFTYFDLNTRSFLTRLKNTGFLCFFEDLAFKNRRFASFLKKNHLAVFKWICPYTNLGKGSRFTVWYFKGHQHQAQKKPVSMNWVLNIYIDVVFTHLECCNFSI